MAYSQNEKSTGLDTLTDSTLAQGDLHIIGDVSDSGRAKTITENLLEDYIANSTNFVDELVANAYFTTELANDSNFIDELTNNSTFQSSVNSFVSVSGGGGGGAGGKPITFAPTQQASTIEMRSGYIDREANICVSGSGIVINLQDDTGYTQARTVTSDWATAEQIYSYALLGSYLYLLLYSSTGPTCRVYRYDATDLSSGGTLMTFSGATLGATATCMTSNGTKIFINYDAGQSANSYAIGEFTISGTVLTDAGTTNCGSTAAQFSAIFAVDADENFYGSSSGIFYQYDNTGTLQYTSADIGSNTALLNWSNTLYGFGGNDPELWSKLYLPDTEINSSNGVIINMTAAEDLVAGTPVGVSNLVNNTVSRSVVSSNEITSTGLLANNNSRTVSIATDKIVTCYVDSSLDLYAVVITIDRSDLLSPFTIGTPQLITNDMIAGNEGYDIHKLDTDKFAVAYITATDPDEAKMVAATVSGTTISLGTPVVAGATVGAVDMEGLAICQIDTDRGVLAFNGDATAGTNAARAYTYSGTVATYGTQVVTSDNLYGVGTVRVEKVGTEKFAIVGVNSPNGYTQLGTVATNTITLGSAVQFTTGAGGNGSTWIVSPATDVMIIRYDTTRLICATISGTTPTFGTALNASVSANGGYVVDSNTIYAFQSTFDIRKITRSGTTLTSTSAAADINVVAQSQGKSVTNCGGYFLATRFNDSNGGSLDYFIEGMSNNFIGIAQNTVSKGSTVRVLTNGIDTHQTGLFPGGIYSVTSGTLTFITTLSSVNTIDDIWFVQAISDTSIKI